MSLKAANCLRVGAKIERAAEELVLTLGVKDACGADASCEGLVEISVDKRSSILVLIMLTDVL